MRDPLDAAARALARGELVVYPTDTLWGLGARATDPKAVERLYTAKGRPTSQPVSIAVSSLEEIEPLAELTEPQRAFLRTELPGAVTALVAPSEAARRTLSPRLFGPGPTLGIRIPDHPTARELARRAGPITCTSANRHGAPDPRGVAGMRSQLGASVAHYLTVGPAPRGSASRIVILTQRGFPVVRG
jgi:L-threonylcarbamoyladenylate synthase